MTDSTTENDATDEASETQDRPLQENGPSPGAEVAAHVVRTGKRYQRYRMTLAVGEWTVEVLLLIALLVMGWSVGLRESAARATGNPWLIALLYIVPVGMLFAVVSMIFSALRTFALDRRFGLSMQSSAVWLADEIKAMAVAGILGLTVVEILYALLRRFPASWWIWAGAAFALLLALLSHLAPVVIFPLFFRFTRLTDPEIAGRFERLAQRAGTRITGVYEVNLSRKTRVANAALVGFGRTRRILLADNLLDNFTLDEIETVLAHELAHHKYNHLSKALALQTGMLFLLCWVIHLVLGAFDGKMGLQGTADIANLPVIALSTTMTGLLVLPLINGLLRHFERIADDYVLEVAARPEAFAFVLQRLAQMNLADRTPNPLIEWIFHNHPSIENRIKRLESAMKVRERQNAE